MSSNQNVWAHACDDAPPDTFSSRSVSGDPVAMIVVHGMGQPVPFQTLEEVVKALRDAEERAGRPRPTVCLRRVELEVDGHLEPFNRAKLWIGPQPGDAESGDAGGRWVHLYEVFWAPIPEGKVTAGDVVRFLLGALWHNRRLHRSKGYLRYVFGRMRTYPLVRRWIVLQLLAVFGLLLSLLAINAVVAGIAALGLVQIAVKGTWLTSDLFYALLGDMGGLVATTLLFVIGIAWAPGGATNRATMDPTEPSISAASRWGWAFIALGVISLIAIATLMLLHALTVSGGDVPGSLLTIGFALLWCALVWGTYFVRRILVQYVGDVAAYVSAHSVNRFWEIRAAIYNTALRVARAVYGAKGAEGRHTYEHVVAVGHSLGSLIAYDMLNGVFLDDYLAARHESSPGGSGGPTLAAVERTAALVTTGSPLDKTAFLFRLQRPMGAVVREVLSNVIQPMILHEGFRPKRWINIYSWNDIISGHLDYYDAPSSDSDFTPAVKVENLFDHEAHRPLLAHTQYWSNALFGTVLLRALGVAHAQE